MNVIEVLIAIIVIVGFVYFSMYNAIKRLGIKVDEAESGIDVALAKRYAVLTNLLETVKGYAKHEKEVLVDIVKARKEMTLAEKEKCDQQNIEAQSKLFALQESYPDLKANENFMHLQKSIVDVEEHLQAARRMYNANVAAFNEKILTFPSNLVANTMDATKRDYFEANYDEKNNVNIKI